MDHHALEECIAINQSGSCIQKKIVLCGKTAEEERSFNLNEYWQTCGSWYEERNITKEQFSTFKFSNGFRKGDIIIIFGLNKEKLKIGQVLIFQSKQPTPIIHRIISLSPLQTKGDHNDGQIGITPDSRGIDETNIKENQIIGVAVGKIPYVGWVKIYALEHPLPFWTIVAIILLFSFYNPFSKK
jgi:signal peptidase I